MLISLLILVSSVAQASVTHTASVSMDLVQVDEKGEARSLESQDGDFFLDWNSKKCEIRLKKSKFVYCTLDTSTDIHNSKGELVMKSLPQAHFEGNVMDALVKSMGQEDRRTKNIINKVVDETMSNRAQGFDLPFYSCGDCEKNGKDLLLWNAYQSYILRDLSYSHSSLGKNKLILRMKIKEMKAVKGAFNIIGNNNASRYGQ